MAVILFGSQSGNAEEISKLLHEDVKKVVKGIRLYSFDHYLKENKSIDTLDREKLIIIVCSTTGEGDPPENAKKAKRAILSKGDGFLRGSAYTVLGLGDSNYSNFNAMGKFWDKQLSRVGARRFYPVGLADDGTSLDLVVEPFRKGLAAAIRKELPDLLAGGASGSGSSAAAAADKKSSPNPMKEPEPATASAAKPQASVLIAPVATPVVVAPVAISIGKAEDSEAQKTCDTAPLPASDAVPAIATAAAVVVHGGEPSFVSIPLAHKQDLLTQMLERRAALAQQSAAAGTSSVAIEADSHAPTVLDHVREVLEDQKLQEMLARELVKKSNRSWFGPAVSAASAGGWMRPRASMDDKRESEKPISRVSSAKNLAGGLSRVSSALSLADKVAAAAAAAPASPTKPAAPTATSPVVAKKSDGPIDRPRSPQLIQKEHDHGSKSDATDHKDANARHTNSKTEEAKQLNGDRKMLRKDKPPKERDPNKPQRPSSQSAADKERGVPKLRECTIRVVFAPSAGADDHKTSEPTIVKVAPTAPAQSKQRDEYFVTRWKNIDTESASKGYSAESPFFGRITAARWLTTARSHRPRHTAPHNNSAHHHSVQAAAVSYAKAYGTSAAPTVPTPNVNLVVNGSGVTAMRTANGVAAAPPPSPSPSIVAKSQPEARSNGHNQNHSNGSSAHGESSEVVAVQTAHLVSTTPSAEPAPRPATAIAQAAAQSAQPPDAMGGAVPSVSSAIDLQHTPRRILHLEIELPSGHDGVMYEPGDAVGVYCPNDERIVDAMLHRLRLDGSRVIQGFTPATADQKTLHIGHIMYPCTVRDVFLYCVDVSSPPRLAFLRMLAEFCSDESERETLKLWCSRAGKAEYENEITKPHTGLWELLCDFRSCLPPLDYLIDQLPPLAPRSYSVTSSGLVHPSHVHIAFTLVEYTTKHVDRHTKHSSIRRKFGVATHFLYRLAVASGLLAAEPELDTCPLLELAGDAEEYKSANAPVLAPIVTSTDATVASRTIPVAAAVAGSASSPRSGGGDPHDWWAAAAAMTAREQASKTVAGLGPLPGSFRTNDGRSVTVPIFIKRSQHFGVPDDPADPMIMIGPGTGVCPFRGFLQHRHVQRHAREQGCGAGVCEGYWRGLQLANEGIEEGDEGDEDIESLRSCSFVRSPSTATTTIIAGAAATAAAAAGAMAAAAGADTTATATTTTAAAAPALHKKESSGTVAPNTVASLGEALLFFGCRREDEDFLYRDDFHAFVSNQTLSSLHTAFSREHDQKVYVQHRIKQNGKRIASLILEKKAQVFVCGDGSHMARDVQAAIIEVLQSNGGLSPEKARAVISEMMAAQRYVQDIWS